MKKYGIATGVSAAVLIFSIIMLFLFPREGNLALSTVFAILFWISLLVTAYLAFWLIKKAVAKYKRKKNSTYNS